MRRFLVTSLVAALAALTSLSPAAAQSNLRAYQAVCEAQGGTFLFPGDCLASRREPFSERERATQKRACEAQGARFISGGSITHCLP